MRDVLFLSYFFPPMGGGAVLRALKFVEYLPTLGWRPLVVAGAGGYHASDASRVDELPAEARELFRRFLEIEEGHLALVQAQIDFVTGTGYWFDVREFNLEG